MAGFVFDFDGEAGVGGDVEVGIALDGLAVFRAVEDDFTGATDDVHTLGGFGAEVIGAGEDHAEGFLAAVRHDDGMGNDFSIEVDIGLCLGGDVLEFHGRAMVRGRPRLKKNSETGV